jgi:hypothetical protein
MKIEVTDDERALIVKALEHYFAYARPKIRSTSSSLERTSRTTAGDAHTTRAANIRPVG